MDPFDRICVLIPTINESTLPAVVEAVKSQAPSIEILILGYGSAGDVAKAQGVHFLDFGKRTLKTIALNKGVESTDRDWIINLDADAVPQPGWAQAMLREFENGRQLFSPSVDISVGNIWMRVHNLSMFHEFLPGRPASFRKYLPGISLAYTRDFYRKNGPFGENLRRAEDFDWTLRAYLNGVSPFFTPSPVVRHLPVEKDTFQSLMRLWYAGGYEIWLLRIKYSSVLHTPFFFKSPFFILLTSPLLALQPTFRILRTSPAAFFRNIHLIPFVYLTKIVWCFGVYAGARRATAAMKKQP